MINFIESSNERTEETEKCLDPQLWRACAGSMVQIPPVNSSVFYFPQGHLEHSGIFNFSNAPRFPAYIPCRVSAIKFLADSGTDEVFARIRLAPKNEVDFDLDRSNVGIEDQGKPASFAKMLTQSDANNGGGFSVPRYCAETIFPRLDYSSDPPVQTILARDVHGGIWKFRHIYRGTPKRHLLTTGWSAFVNHKKLIAGDSVVFFRVGKGDLCIGIRRAKKGLCSDFFGEDDTKDSMNGSVLGDVIEAANLAVNGKSFDVVYYPRGGTPDFFVKDTLVMAALKVRWCSGMRFKMAFETEDSSRISWFMGTISSFQVADPVRWPDSPWRLLQVVWDEPDLLQNVQRVNPWLVELASNIPTIHPSPFSFPPHKKMRLPQHPDFPRTHFLGLGSPLSCPGLNYAPAGIQGARHGGYGLIPISYPPFDRALGTATASNCITLNERVSCVLTMGNSVQEMKKMENKKAAPLVLFGQQILTAEQISLSCSNDAVSTSDFDEDKIGSCSDGSNSVHDRTDANLPSSCEGFQSEMSAETSEEPFRNFMKMREDWQL